MCKLDSLITIDDNEIAADIQKVIRFDMLIGAWQHMILFKARSAKMRSLSSGEFIW